MTNEPARVDPIVVELVRNGVIAVTEEMKTHLMRTAYNMIIYEALDFTVGLFTARGETVSIGLGLPMFIRGMAETIKAKLAHFGSDGIEGRLQGDRDTCCIDDHVNANTIDLPRPSQNLADQRLQPYRFGHRQAFGITIESSNGYFRSTHHLGHESAKYADGTGTEDKYPFAFRHLSVGDDGVVGHATRLGHGGNFERKLIGHFMQATRRHLDVSGHGPVHPVPEALAIGI